MAADDGIPLAWIVVFVLLALGFGAWAIFFVGGDPTAGVAVPVLSH